MEKDFFQRQLSGGRKKLGLGGRLRLDSGTKLFERTLGDELSAMNDSHVAAKAFDDFEDVRGEKDRSPTSNHALKHGFQGAGGDRIDAFEGFVKKKDLGAVDYGGCEGQLFLHAMGIVGDELARLIGELHEVEELRGAPRADVAIEAVHSADERQVLRSGEPAEESQSLGHDADLPLHIDNLALEVQPQNFDSA